MHERYKSLKKYVEHMNYWYSLEHGDDESNHYEYPVRSQATADAIFKELEQDLSPECLHCDGEISVEKANAKLKKLLAIGRSLQWAGFGVNTESELGSYIAYSDA